MIKEAIGRYANLSRINLTKTNKKINAVADHLTTLYRFNPKSQPYRTFASLTGNSDLTATFVCFTDICQLSSGSGNLVPFFHNLCQLSRIISLYFAHFGANSSRLVAVFHLSSDYSTLVPNFHLNWEFSSLVPDFHLSWLYSSLVPNSHLNWLFHSLVPNSHLSLVFSSLVPNFHLSANFGRLV